MKKKCTIYNLATALTIAIVWSVSVSAKEPTPYVETPITLKAKDVLPAELLRGENYVVEANVVNDGLINTYQLTTNYGPLIAESTAELMVRIAELDAMKAMEVMDKKKVFGNAVVAGVKAPFQGAWNLVTSPVETTQGIAKGTGQFMSNVGRSVVSDDPYQDNAFKVIVGYDTAKRAFAYDLGIDPYSDYEPAMSMLGRVSQASVAGGITPRVAMAAVGTDVTMVMQFSSTAESMRKLVRDNPPGELQKINAEKLAKMGIQESVANAFLSNTAYDPQELTLLVGELERLKGVKGQENFIAVAGLASEKTVALYYRIIAQMMADYHTQISPAESIGRISRTPYLREKDGKVVLLLPLDFVFRTAEVKGKLDKLDEGFRQPGGVSKKELWITGRVDAGARKMIEASGWKIVENANKQLTKK